MSGQLVQLELRAPKGAVAPKYNLFRYVGEAGWPRRFQEIWAIGDVGTGKSTALIDSIYFSLYYYPRARIAVARSTLVELQSAFIPDIQQRLRPLFEAGYLEYIRDLAIIRAANGSEVHLFGIDAADNKLWGQQWFRAFIDQAERIRPDMLDLLHTRVRQQVRHKDSQDLGTTYVKLTANWDRGRDWVYKRVEEDGQPLDKNGDILEKVVKRTVAGKTYESRILVIHSRTTENEELTEDYFKHLVLAGKLSERAVRGGYTRGDDDSLVFPEYTSANLTDVLVPLEGSTCFVGIDHGIWHPTVGVFFARDYDGKLYSVREYIRKNAPAQHNAEALADVIYDLANRGVETFYAYGDPSMWNRSATTTDMSSVADIYQEVFASIDVPVYFSPAFGTRRASESRTGRRVGGVGTIEYGVGIIKDALRKRRLFINPRLTPKLDGVLTDLTYDDVQGDTMTKVDVFDAARYAVTNARIFSMDGEHRESAEARPFTIRRDADGPVSY
jgi:hypothetical protein